ncbi:hypothetical protein BCR33DRAFT_849224 [Rhizoclosmatium globosum]|uniref:Glycine transporter domain-containing protein n=1 Tax=Rhizoclosmatium globosum TaxID=329046 RepID=A0A1Y2CI85_9FUNG|nr:hypothetical protein BCR33DRAFT_849224 [Rhizoclosmatium globosum]|eukprot:ORY46534.1 hypothetical protein BCR33DRAFT_849224 [Rhizoclosmatium globosum]
MIRSLLPIRLPFSGLCRPVPPTQTLPPNFRISLKHPRAAFLSTSTPTPTSPSPQTTTTTSNGITSPREGLPAGPASQHPSLLRSLDWFGTAAFAVSGAITASTCGTDVFGAVVVGTITAVGGGTLRDALVLNKTPFWVEEWEYLIDGEGGEGVVLAWADAIGLGAFAVIGAMNGLRAGCPLLVSAICGMMTATFGGLTRDALLNRPVRILHPYSDLYAPIAFTGAAAYLAMRSAAPQLQGVRIAVAVVFTVLLRQQAWINGWRFPHWDLPSENVIWSTEDPRKKKRDD